MKIAVVGSRDFDQQEYLFEELDLFIQNTPEITIISGGAKGADLFAKQYAHQRGFKYEEFKPDWKQFGRGAGLVRNTMIVEACDVLIAFWDEKSKGTRDSISKAEKLEKRVIVFHTLKK